MQWQFGFEKTPGSSTAVVFNLDNIAGYFSEINQLHRIQLEQLRQTSSRKHVEVLNQLKSDLEYINELLVRTIINNNDDNKQKFLIGYNIAKADLRDFKFHGFKPEEL